MKFFAGSAVTAVLFFFLFLTPAEAAPTMAFGYLANNSGDPNFDYLETIFPNSFANSIKNIFDVNVIKPISVNKLLKKYRQKLEKNYQPYQLPDLAEKTGVDLFIYGSFTPLPNDRIKIVLHLYAENSKRIFTFTNIGKMETEIFRLVDRITDILINFMDSSRLYLTRKIPAGSRIGFFTNLEADDLNAFYFPFISKGFRIAYIQGNTPGDGITFEDMNIFENISTKDNSYDIITDMRKVTFLMGTWAGERYKQDMQAARKLFQKNDLYYQKTKNRALEKLYRVYRGKLDYLIIAGFNKGKNRAWVRAIDLKRKDLIWMESNIKGDIREIGRKMITRMTGGTKKRTR